MDPGALQRYLHDHIPLSAAMGAAVLEADESAVVLCAPLAPNINHRETVFGGSQSALAILAAWSLIHLRLQTVDLSPRLVIQRNTIEYRAPILADFTARSFLLEPDQWGTFLHLLRQRGRGRVRVGVTLEADGLEAGTFAGDFVAIDTRLARSRQSPRA